jgi:hypothetical protein
MQQDFAIAAIAGGAGGHRSIRNNGTTNGIDWKQIPLGNQRFFTGIV